MIRLPRPSWIGLPAGVLLVVTAGLWFALPIFRQLAAVRAIESRGGAVGTA